MNIGIVYNDHEKSILFINLALYLKKLGHVVIFLNPQSHIKHYLKTYDLTTASYKDSDACAALLQDMSFDRLIFWNGERNFEKSIAESLNIPSWYIENGYWQSDTLQVNKGGVNYGADYAQLSPAKLLEFSYPTAHLTRQDITIHADIPLPVSSYLLFQSKKLFTKDHLNVWKSLYAIFIKKLAQWLYKHKKNPRGTTPNSSYIFFPLQVTKDTQLIHNSPYTSMKQVVRLFTTKLPKNKSVIIKEHPKETSVVSYNAFAGPQAQIITHADLEKLITESDFLVNINSSVGFQALEKHKKVLHLGSSFYENFPGVVSCNLLHDSLPEKIAELEALSPDWKLADKLFTHFRSTIFIPGSWRAPTISLLHKIAERVLSS